MVRNNVEAIAVDLRAHPGPDPVAHPGPDPGPGHLTSPRTFKSSRENAELDRIRPTPDGPRPISAAKMGSTGITQPNPTLLTNCEPVSSAAALHAVATCPAQSDPASIGTSSHDSERVR